MSRHEDRGKPYSRPQPQGPRRPTHQPQQFRPHRAQCFLCGGPYMKNACPQISSRRTCHGCGKEGHFIRDCPTSRSALPRPPSQLQLQQSRGGVTPQAAGRVYTMTGTKAVRSGNLIIGSCMIAGRSLCVLYDSGATHSFVSESKVLELGLPVRELQFDLVVSTPTSGIVRTSTLCARCLIEVEGHKYRVNLICLPLEGLDVIIKVILVLEND